ncbi:MAG: twin-arginine translocation signal domain-containing protein, partial [Desulfobacterales bacterium]|nr:twin-arginine translocation signal domain-containing protein [Desulfobacterales bacterium]
MSYFQKKINRRGFLQKSAVMTAGCLLGFKSLSKTLALEGSNNNQPVRRIALIIDDIGYSVSRARRFLELGV